MRHVSSKRLIPFLGMGAICGLLAAPLGAAAALIQDGETGKDLSRPSLTIELGSGDLAAKGAFPDGIQLAGRGNGGGGGAGGGTGGGFGDGTGTSPQDGSGMGPGDGTQPQPQDGTGFGQGPGSGIHEPGTGGGPGNGIHEPGTGLNQ